MQGRLLVVGAALCWSVGGAAVKIAQKGLDAYQIAGFRALFALLFFCVMVRPWRAKRLWPGFRVALVSVAYAAMLILFILANTLTTAANSIFLQDTAPVWVALLAPYLLKEKFRYRELLVLLICGIGMFLFFQDQLDFEQKTGNVLALLSGVAYALVILGLRWGRPKEDPKTKDESPARREPTDAEVIVVWGNALCLIVCLPWMVDLSTPTPKAVPLVVACLMGLIQIGVGYYLLTLGIRHVPAAQASLLALVEPVLNPVWAFLAVGETPGPWAMAGAVVVLAALAFQAFSRGAEAEDDEHGAGQADQSVETAGVG